MSYVRKLWRVRGTRQGKYKLQYSRWGMFWCDLYDTNIYDVMYGLVSPTLYDSVEEAEQAATAIANKELEEYNHKNKIKKLGRLP